jgi:hypothetical protein
MFILSILDIKKFKCFIISYIYSNNVNEHFLKKKVFRDLYIKIDFIHKKLNLVFENWTWTTISNVISLISKLCMFFST